MDRDNGPRVRVPEQRAPEKPVTPDALRFTVLGPVRAWRGPELLSSGSPQQRALLAALLLREGRTATAGELIDAFWGEDPPSQALATIRTYASRLRKILGQDTLVSESGGYAIRTDRAALDLTLAQDLAAEAEKARAAGDRCQARTLINKVLGLWDGEALASVPGPYADNQRTRLEEWRLQLTETRLDLDLEVGCHAEAVSELTALTAAHPLRERLRELLMVALYRSGRQAEALAVYADTRRLLAEELGVDPRPELAQLQQRILRADEELARPADEPAPAPAPLRPAQLPATVPDFTGRSAFVSELGSRLATAESSVMAVSAVAGIGGVGKTTLAVHVAHQARRHFPDGQLYVDLQGAGARVAEPETVLGSFLRALGTADSAIPDTLDERAALYRSTLDGRRILILLDNAHDAAQIRPLLPGTPGCAALVTSRVRMVDLAGAHLVDLDVMSPEEALQLFTRIVGAERVGAEREAALDVVAACGFLPLAIRIAASRLAARRTWTVSVLAAKLADERRRLDELQAGDLAVKATFELGYGQLEPAQARAFRLLGLADGPDISLAAAAALLDLDPHVAEDLLEALVDTSLVESAAPGRYRYHDLVRLYARACAERDEQSPVERELALSRLLDFYLATAAGVYALERPGDRLADHREPTQYSGLTFADRHTAQDWLYTEANSLLACVRQASGAGGVRRAVDLLWATKDLAESGANSKQYEAAAITMRDLARSSDDARAEGRALITLTNARLVAGRFDQAERDAQRAMRLARAVGDPLPSCWAPTTSASSRSTRTATRRARPTSNRPSPTSGPTATVRARRAPCATSPASTSRWGTRRVRWPWPSRASTYTTNWATRCAARTVGTPWASPSPRAGGSPTRRSSSTRRWPCSGTAGSASGRGWRPSVWQRWISPPVFRLRPPRRPSRRSRCCAASAGSGGAAMSSPSWARPSTTSASRAGPRCAGVRRWTYTRRSVRRRSKPYGSCWRRRCPREPATRSSFVYRAPTWWFQSFRRVGGQTGRPRPQR